MQFYLKKRNLKKEQIKNKKNNKNLIRNKLVNFLFKTKLFEFLSEDNKNLVIKNYEILSTKVMGSRILFISDLHLDIIDNTDKVIELLKEEDKFDVIVFGGDFFDNDEKAKTENFKWDNLISFLKTKSNNIISVLGNHDGNNTISLISKDVKLLINKKFNFNELSFFGIEDYVSFKETKDFNKISKNKFNILISHTPDFVFKVSNKYDLMISGHTHGGQINIFNKKPIKNCLNKKTLYGRWKINGINGITTSGLGCSGYPYRYKVNPELVIININKKESD